MAPTLTPSQIYTLLLQGGFDPEDARIMTAIAQAESSRDVGAVGDVALQNGTWGPSVGLFQVRTLRAETGSGGTRDIEALTGNPAAQVQAALSISGGGTNFRPWSTYTNGSYRQYLDTPLEAGVPVDPSFAFAAGGGGAPAADPFAIDAGVRLADVTDTDGDGLTDDFEALFGTDVNRADTDGDGLSDAHETATSHTDPTLADTDRDGVNDGAEGAAGTDAGQGVIPVAARTAGFGGTDDLDSDADGLSDAYERRLGTDPMVADSDLDGLGDGAEVAGGSDPRSMDGNNDGLTDRFASEHGILAADLLPD